MRSYATHWGPCIVADRLSEARSCCGCSWWAVKGGGRLVIWDEAIALQGLRSRARGRDVWPRRKRRLHLYSAPWWLLPKRHGSGSSTSLQRSSDATVSGTTGVAHLGVSITRRAVRFSHGRAMARATGGGCGAAAVCGCVAPLSVTTLSVTVACCSRQGWAGDADAVPCAAVIASRHAATQCCENRVAVLGLGFRVGFRV